jgi:hypothetical protein
MQKSYRFDANRRIWALTNQPNHSLGGDGMPLTIADTISQGSLILIAQWIGFLMVVGGGIASRGSQSRAGRAGAATGNCRTDKPVDSCHFLLLSSMIWREILD